MRKCISCLARKIGLGGDKSSYSNPGRNLSTMGGGGRARRGLEPLVEAHKEVKQKVTSPKQGRGEFFRRLKRCRETQMLQKGLAECELRAS